MLQNIEINKDLTCFNSLAFASIAEKFVAVKSESELLQTITHAQSASLTLQVISGGSNLLMAEFIPGLTVQMQLKGINVVAETESDIVLRVCAGECWHQLVEHTVDNNYQGIENLALIPGLVGAAPIQNIGAYGSEIKDVLVSVRAFDLVQNTFVELNNVQCQFEYRDSVFKQNKGQFVVCSIDIKLSKRVSIAYKYQAISDYLSINKIENVGLKDIFNAICAIRSEKLPLPADVPNAGSFFKNPLISQAHYNALKQQNPNIVGYTAADGKVKVAAGWLIENCGWKGYSENGVGVYSKQALVLVHTGGANLDTLLALAEKIKQSIFEKFEIPLEVEPQLFPSPG